MIDFLLQNYSWLKAFHLIAVISWMAGLLYLPRLFVYHVGAPKGGELSETLKIMEHRLLRYIMNPAMIVTWLLGITMIVANSALMTGDGWLHVKLLLVILLSGFHMACSVWRKKFARDENVKSAKFFRFANEVPTILMIVIVILAVVKPF